MRGPQSGRPGRRTRIARAGLLMLGGSLGCLAAAQLTQPAAAWAATTATTAPAIRQRPASGPSWPVTITIRTVPALPGIGFTFDGSQLVTDASGAASVTEPHNFSNHTLALIDTRILTRHRRYHFTRWAGERNPDEAFRPTVSSLPMRANYTVTAAFTASCPVRPHFTDQSGRILDRRRISRVTLKSDTGQQVDIPAVRRSWVACVRPVYRNSMLTSHAIAYSVQSVVFSGTNIVHSGVEDLRPGSTPRPTFVGYFHDLTITAHDALFGGRTGGDAVVTLPDHAVRLVPLGAGHSATLDNLPQGDYQVNIRARGAIVSAQTLRLSRSTTVDLTAVSPGDLIVIIGGLLLAAVLLPLLSATRRRRLIDHLRTRQGRHPKGSPA